LPGTDRVEEHLREAIRARLSALDRLLEHRVRLTTAVLLAPGRQLSFADLKGLTGESDGSLGAHLKRLSEADYLAVERGFVAGRPLTRYTLTPRGLAALERHLDALEGLLADALT
jgi:DNA-binding MarR family transcriptional regulator